MFIYYRLVYLYGLDYHENLHTNLIFIFFIHHYLRVFIVYNHFFLKHFTLNLKMQHLPFLN